MENKKHRWYDVIVAWANGEKIQYKVSDDWCDFLFDGLVPGFYNEGTQWRIKPKTVTKLYRMALVRFFGEFDVRAVDITGGHNEYNIEGFIRWVGETVEVEIEV